MGLFKKLQQGLERSREAINEIFYFGGEVDESFWEDLEDTLVMGDMGADIAMQVTDDLRDLAARKNLKTAAQLRGALADLARHLKVLDLRLIPVLDVYRHRPSPHGLLAAPPPIKTRPPPPPPA